MEWHITQIAKGYQKDSFDCGKPSLNEYLKVHAGQNHRRGSAKAYIAVPNSEKRVIGFYTISMSEIAFESLPEDIRRGLGRYPGGAMLIGQFAVDRSCQGMGIGKTLLFDALNRAIGYSEGIGVIAVRVDAVDEEAKSFYTKYGFKEYEDPRKEGLIPLLLPISVLLKTRSQNPVA